jgi:Cu+-exporting ATPase
VVLFIAAIAAIYWYKHNPNNVWPAVTSVLIIACPCALLLSNTFTNGNVLRILSRNGLYLRNAQTIEEIANANHIVFDKTGTLTTQHHLAIKYEGEPLDNTLYHKIAVLAAQSSHPLSKAIAASLHSSEPLHISAFKEVPGKGIEGIVEDDLISLGAKNFVYQGYNSAASFDEQSVVYVAVENELKGKFVFQNEYRKNIEPAIQQLKKHYCFTVLSGDNNGEQKRLEKLFGKNAMLLFRQQPEDKLTYIQHLQQKGGKVIMLGDGLNDAGALKQANAGIAVTDNANNFTPSSDAIIAADKLSLLPTFIRFCKTNKKIVLLAFTISVIYNIIGIYFAVQATLSPLIAAILMPSSSISIIIVTYGFSSLAAKKLSL